MHWMYLREERLVLSSVVFVVASEGLGAVFYKQLDARPVPSSFVARAHNQQ